MLAIDRHAWTNRWRSIHPLEKLLFAGGLMVLGFVRPDPAGAGVALAAALLATRRAGVPVRAFLAVLALPAGFLLAGAPALALSWQDGARFGLAVTPDGLALALRVSLRALAAAAALSFLVLTTPMADLLRLGGRLGLPAAVLDIAFLIHRLIFVVLERARAARLAQSARLGYSGFGRAVRSSGMLAAGLFVRSLARGRRLEIGLSARGWQGELRVLAVEPPLSRIRLAGIAAGLALTTLVAAVVP